VKEMTKKKKKRKPKVYGNTVTNSNQNGITLYTNATNNTITGCTISGDTYSITVDCEDGC